jgi:hypothetical protein
VIGVMFKKEKQEEMTCLVWNRMNKSQREKRSYAREVVRPKRKVCTLSKKRFTRVLTPIILLHHHHRIRTKVRRVIRNRKKTNGIWHSTKSKNSKDEQSTCSRQHAKAKMHRDQWLSTLNVIHVQQIHLLLQHIHIHQYVCICGSKSHECTQWEM